MLRIVDNGDVVLAERIKLFDPFQLATTRLWEVRNLLPPERIICTLTREQLEKIDKEKIMAIKLIAETEAPLRVNKKGSVTASTEYSEVMEALRTIKPGQAIVVKLESKELQSAKKPEIAFSYALRRFFEARSVNYTAYQSGKMEVTIKKHIKPPTNPNKKKDGNK
jgi:hypothetical protein